MAVSTAISTLGLGSFLPAIPPIATLAIWIWCFAWMQVADAAKLLAYRLLDLFSKVEKKEPPVNHEQKEDGAAA